MLQWGLIGLTVPKKDFSQKQKKTQIVESIFLKVIKVKIR